MRRILLSLGLAIGLTNCGSDSGHRARDAGAPHDSGPGGPTGDAGGGNDGGPGGGDAHDGGDGDGGLGDARCPAQMARVSVPDGGAVCVDRYEAATVVLAPDGGTAPHPYDQPVDGIGNGLTIAAVVAANLEPMPIR